jgi:hypothetical protein
MSETYYTIVCKFETSRELLDLPQLLMKDELDISYTPIDLRWDSIKVTSSRCVIQLNRLVKDEPGDKYSKLILGLFNYFNKLKYNSESQKKTVLGLVSEAKCLIGVVCEASDSNKDNCYRFVLELAQLLNACVFTGNDLVDASGSSLTSRP